MADDNKQGALMPRQGTFQDTALLVVARGSGLLA